MSPSEIAAKVRHANGIFAFVSALGIDVDSDWCWADVSMRVADLIDPICQEVPMESVGRWPFYTGIELHLEKVSYGCSACGYPWGEIDKWATHGADWLHNSPKYCPNCGCRVVKGVMR